MKQYPAYLAAPWFNEHQVQRHDVVLALLKQFTTGVLSPKEMFVCPPDADEKIRRDTFLGNLRAIQMSRFVIAITDGKDPGTLWEMGYAFREGIPVVGCAFTLGDKPFNLMLAQGCVNVVKTVKGLHDILTHYDEYNKLTPGNYDGSIE